MKIDNAVASLENVSGYIKKLKNEKTFNFKFTLNSDNKSFTKLSLGPSSYGLKIYLMLDLINELSPEEKNKWANYINSFQTSNNKFPENSFIDEDLIKYYEQNSLQDLFKDTAKKILNNFSENRYDTHQIKLKKAINAETKQAVSTLYDFGFKNEKPLPSSMDDHQLLKYLDSLNWNEPWSSGAQFASMCVFSETQNYGRSVLLYDYITGLLDQNTGTYHSKNSSVSSREKINGSMKVISGLKWINQPIHNPEKLIDFCLLNEPKDEGCDLVDYIYVLYNCLKESDYKKTEVLNILDKMLESLIKLQRNDGGFSYFKQKSQTHYYGVEVTAGLNQSDIHGTLLITWAIILILDILTNGDHKYKIIKP